MSEKSGFFDAKLAGDTYDRIYKASNFADYFSSFIGNGVFSPSTNKLKVTALDTPEMSVNILSGQAFIYGYWYKNSETMQLPIDASDSALNRIDLVVLKLDYDNRSIQIEIVKGTPASTPVAPTLERDSSGYCLELAQILISAGVSAIVQTSITDKRMDSSVCGIVTGVINQIDLEDVQTIYEQYASEIKSVSDQFQSKYSTDEAAYKNQVNQLVSSIETTLQAALDKTLAGHLQNEIDNLQTNVNTQVSTVETNLDNKTKQTILTIPISGWVSDSDDSRYPYANSITVNHIYKNSPIIAISSSDGTTIPTDAQVDAYNEVKSVKASGTTLKFYAESAQTVDFYVVVEGVD